MDVANLHGRHLVYNYYFIHKFYILIYIMEKYQYGGFLPLGIVGMIGQAFAFVGQLIKSLMQFVFVTGLPYILTFLKFTLISTFLLCIFGFFGIFATVVAIFYFYFKLFKDIKGENRLLRNWTRRSQGLSR